MLIFAIEQTFMLFRQSIYDTSPKFVFDNKAELDEAMFKGHKKGKCDRELQENTRLWHMF